MSRVKEIKKQTDNKFLNLYDYTVFDKNGNEHPYYVASRHSEEEVFNC